MFVGLHWLLREYKYISFVQCVSMASQYSSLLDGRFICLCLYMYVLLFSLFYLVPDFSILIFCEFGFFFPARLVLNNYLDFEGVV